MKRYTPDEFARQIAPDRIARAIEERFRRITPAVRRAVAGHAVSNRMRDTSGEPVRRYGEDTGPLRSTSRARGPVRYAKAVRGGNGPGTGPDGSIDRVVQTAPLRVSYEMGVDLDLVPQGLNEATRPTFTVSIKTKARELRQLVQDAFVAGLRGLVR